MKIFERSLAIPREYKEWDKGLTRYISDEIYKTLSSDEELIRFVVVETDDKHYHLELQIAKGENVNGSFKKYEFQTRYNGLQDIETFNVVLNIPTGVDAEIGGESGDATPVARMIAKQCDNLILHPNVVNASDINEMAPNSLYVEGSTLSSFMLGHVGLKKVRSNRILLITDDTEFTDYAINAVSAARASFGIDCKVLKVKDLYRSEIKYSDSGRPTGEVDGLDKLFKAISEVEEPFDAIGVYSYIHAKKGLSMEYFTSEMINPWGGIEAMITHGIGTRYKMPLAHAPMIESLEAISQAIPVVHPRKAAEAGSITFLQCVLKGLHKSPKILQLNPDNINRRDILSSRNIAALIIPDGCLGQTVTAAIDQGIPVIAVKNKNIMNNDLTKLPFAPGQLIQVGSYLEACGVLSAMKAGVALDTLRRPLGYTKVITHLEKEV